MLVLLSLSIWAGEHLRASTTFWLANTKLRKIVSNILSTYEAKR